MVSQQRAVLLTLVVLFVVGAFAVPASWKKGRAASPNEELKVTFAIQQNFEKISTLFDDIALPSGKNFRQFLSLDELHKLVAPKLKTYEKINSYLHDINAYNIQWTKGNNYVQFRITVADAEKAFGVTFNHFIHKVSGRDIVRSSDSAIQLPSKVEDKIELTLGLLDFFDTKNERKGINKETFMGHPLISRSRNNIDSTNGTNNEPYILMAMGSESQVAVYFYAVCQGGQYTSSTSSPCSEYGNQITEFRVTYQEEGRPNLAIILIPNINDCFLVSNDTVCFVQFTVEPYNRVNITVSSVFANGNAAEYVYPTRYSPTAYITPQMIYDTYNIPIGTRSVNPANSQAIVSFEEQYYSHSDLQKFFTLTGLLPMEPILVGYNNDSMPGGEATLDVQWVMGVGQGVRTTTWSFPEGDYILNWAIAVDNDTNAPLVTSISYGDTEIGYEQKSGYGLQYIYHMNFELQKMALRGLTVIAGSGDAGWSNVGEMGNDLSAPDQTCTPGRAFYPSVSPYVMSLSATFLSTTNLGVCGQKITPVPGQANLAIDIICSGRVAETAVGVSQGMSWTTGGGFSNVTLRHSYQNEAVEHFLNTSVNLPPSEYWNSSGQGYADIATIGWNQLVVWGGLLFPIGGTSASGPVAAGVFALINDALLEAGKQPLGFINPSLYEWSRLYPDAFNDVTYGKNNDGDIQPPGSQYPIYCQYGFDSQAGWDPVSGLGSPNFAKLKELALSKL